MDIIDDSLIRWFVEKLKNNTNKESIKSIYSTIDHILTKMDTEQRIKILWKNPFELEDKIEIPHMVYLAALTEFLYNKENKEPPTWVFDKRFYLEEEKFADSVELFISKVPHSDIKQRYREQAIPEFKKRNYIVTDVLNSY